ncbi:MAG: hypothetical protein S4CHLAM102_06010 [Chlamydiia bacterium]|nr:hypothetical protein [Chlamydiia bacterium]
MRWRLSITWVFLALIIGAPRGQAVQKDGIEYPNFELTVSEEEREKIYTIISTMGEYNVFSLLTKSGELRRLGREVNHVPPLVFLGVAFDDPYLAECMGYIRNNPFKWAGFIDGLSSNITRDRDNGKLYQDLPGFADYLHSDYDQLYRHAQKGDWSKFVNCLIK